jgi:hypothetical protein
LSTISYLVYMRPLLKDPRSRPFAYQGARHTNRGQWQTGYSTPEALNFSKRGHICRVIEGILGTSGRAYWARGFIVARKLRSSAFVQSISGATHPRIDHWEKLIVCASSAVENRRNPRMYNWRHLSTLLSFPQKVNPGGPDLQARTKTRRRQ